MEQLRIATALLMALGGLLTIVAVLGLPFAHREVVVLRLRSRLHRIDDVLAGWEHEAGGNRRSPHIGR
ncbi:MAG: hypothetical protein M3256_11755 [Actinomycetota bacterium]|nr:hypothetical protein [Actinomycetota bacterium]MDQ6946913.1 hypothetical protein [Actinomycetota bacterium]